MKCNCLNLVFCASAVKFTTMRVVVIANAFYSLSISSSPTAHTHIDTSEATCYASMSLTSFLSYYRKRVGTIVAEPPQTDEQTDERKKSRKCDSALIAIPSYCSFRSSTSSPTHTQFHYFVTCFVVFHPSLRRFAMGTTVPFRYINLIDGDVNDGK